VERNVERDHRPHPALGRALALALVALAFAADSHAIDAQKFRPLRSAASAMKVAAAHDPTVERFGELARQLATELLAAREIARSDEERALLLLYARAGLAYGDSLTLWREKLEVQRTDALSRDAPSVKPLVVRYDIPVDSRGTIQADAAIRSLWKVAAKALVKAELFYSGRLEERAAAVDAERRASAEAPAKKPPDARPATDEARRRALIEQVAEEFDHAEREAERPKPYQAEVGNWTCPRGYVLRQGRCLSDDEIARLPKVEIGR
jgi:hypothetical protein